MVLIRQSLWKQFGASIDMLRNAIEQWPEERWHTDKRFFYNAYHALVFLDYYLTYPPKDFKPLLPFTLSDGIDRPVEAIDDVIPDKVYTKQELLDYLETSRSICKAFLTDADEESFAARWVEMEAGEISMDYSMLELLLYNMRHVQHHAAQLNMMLRQAVNDAPRWVARAKDPLSR